MTKAEQLIEQVLSTMEDWEYLIHHLHGDSGKEIIHHCRLYDHKANLYVLTNLAVKDGKATIDGKKIEDGILHVVIGLEPNQEVCWSDDEASKAGISSKRMLDGMTKKDKAKEW